MTAEVVVLNKVAAAIASDSAVSLSYGGTEKTYNSVDKVFQLVPSAPVGIMIYGSMPYNAGPDQKLPSRRDSSFVQDIVAAVTFNKRPTPGDRGRRDAAEAFNEMKRMLSKEKKRENTS